MMISSTVALKHPISSLATMKTHQHISNTKTKISLKTFCSSTHTHSQSFTDPLIFQTQTQFTAAWVHVCACARGCMCVRVCGVWLDNDELNLITSLGRRPQISCCLQGLIGILKYYFHLVEIKIK